MSVRQLESLDEVLGGGAEARLTAAREERQLNQVAVGLVREGESFVRLVSAGLDSRFEIGSLTKTYTAELLAILVGRGVLRLEDPVARYLPGVAGGDESHEAITLEDLATHWSGLPRLAPMEPLTMSDPYATYGARDLEEFLRRRGLKRPAKRGFVYSNLGYSVLGYALGKAEGATYAELLQREILGPLGMTGTALALGQTQANLMQGHNKSGLPVPHWHWDVCAPCGGLCSTVVDQVRWLGWLLEDTARLSFRPRAKAISGGIGLAWLIPATGERCWHNGATGGFSSWMWVDRKRGEGVLILSNRQAIDGIDSLGRTLAGMSGGLGAAN